MKQSQTNNILDHLMKGRGISQQLAIKLFRCYRLSARIHELTSEGWPIKMELVEHAGSRFGLYTISRDFIIKS